MIRVTEANRTATADLFEKGGRYCLKHYDHANTRPVLFSQNNIALLLSGRAGSTFALKWYLHHNNMTSEFAWTHKHRTTVIYPAEWHTARCQAALAGDEFMMVRFTRNPFSRAVSSYLHSTQNEPVYRQIIKHLGHSDGYSFVQFLEFIEHTGPQRVNNHFANQFSYLEHLHELDAFCQIEGGLEALNVLETKLGLPESTEQVYGKLKSSPHNLDYETGDVEGVPDRAFELGKRKIPYPTPDTFYNDQTENMVREIYAKDFARFGYSTTLPDLRPKSSRGSV